MDRRDALWEAVVAAYGRPGVAPLCLRLQQAGDIDVMVLLSLCYAARALAAPLSPAEVHALRDASEPWRARVVRPVRAQRIDLRGPVAGVADPEREAFRDHLKMLELEAERVQAGIAADWLDRRCGKSAADPLSGLRAFLGGTPVSKVELALLLDSFSPLEHLSLKPSEAEDPAG